MSDVTPSAPDQPHGHGLGLAGWTAKTFIHSPLSPLLFFAMLGMGLLGLMATPRQEDPQISVPMIDVFVQFPGASTEQVGSLAVEPLERLLSELPGVKHVYSASEQGQGIITVQFEVGEQMGPSIVKVHDKLQANPHVLPPGALHSAGAAQGDRRRAGGHPHPVVGRDRRRRPARPGRQAPAEPVPDPRCRSGLPGGRARRADPRGGGAPAPRGLRGDPGADRRHHPDRQRRASHRLGGVQRARSHRLRGRLPPERLRRRGPDDRQPPGRSGLCARCGAGGPAAGGVPPAGELFHGAGLPG